jgi:hypothetical protein
VDNALIAHRKVELLAARSRRVVRHSLYRTSYRPEIHPRENRPHHPRSKSAAGQGHGFDQMARPILRFLSVTLAMKLGRLTFTRVLRRSLHCSADP